MLPIGSLVNALAIIVGSVAGCWLQSRFSERIRTIVFQGLGLCVLLIRHPDGSQGRKYSHRHFFYSARRYNRRVIATRHTSGTTRQPVQKAHRIQERNVHRRTDYILPPLLYRGHGHHRPTGGRHPGDTTVLFTKSILDGFAAIAFAATYGSGVLFAFIPVLLYEGAITLGANFFQQYFSELLIAQITGCGGLLIIGISINLLELKEIQLPNLLPALAYVVILTALFA